MAAIRAAALTLKSPGLRGMVKLEQNEKMREKLPAYFGSGFALL
jgi:hypothetical protein